MAEKKKYSNLGLTYKAPSFTDNPYESDESFAAAMESANKANELRYTQGLGLWDKIVGAYQPGGAFGQGAMAYYNLGKAETLGSSAQQLISAGLYGTTTGANLGAGYEAKVGTPFRLNLADLQTKGYTQGLAGAAQFISSKEEQGPDPALYASLKAKAAAAPKAGAIPESIPANPYLSGTSFGGGYTPRYSSGIYPSGGGDTAAQEPIVWGEGYGPAFDSPAYADPYYGGYDPTGPYYQTPITPLEDPYAGGYDPMGTGYGSLGGSISSIDPSLSINMNRDVDVDEILKQYQWM